MSLPRVLLMRLGALYNIAKCGHSRGKTVSYWSRDMRWYTTKVQRVQERRTSQSRTKQVNERSDLLREFPYPKDILHRTISHVLGVGNPSKHIQYSCTEDAGVKRASVTLQGPVKFEEEGQASNKSDAERFAAAAACLRLREMGVIDQNNKPIMTKGGWGKWQLNRDRDILQTLNIPVPVEKTRKQGQLLCPEVDNNISEALALFPQPKALLSRVLEVATASNVNRNVLKYKVTGKKQKTCVLTLKWPEEMTFSAASTQKLMAEKGAAALACMKLKELKLLDKNNNPLTHAMYHQEEVREAAKREKGPLPLEVSESLQGEMREYLAQYPVEADIKKLWEEEEAKGQQMSDQTYEEEEEDLLTDAISGRPYRPLSDRDARQLSTRLQTMWERANPQLSVALPVDAHRERVVSAVQASRVVVIDGETGCGKTTRIPRFLLEDQVRSGEGAECNILVTQPRRISAVSVAHRVAQEMGPALDDCVGYQVRLESRPPERSGGALLFLTVGVLLRKLQSNPSLKGISHVVVDEVHERDINTDLLLALLRSVLNENPNLRVVLMSATGDNQKLANYFGGCPLVKVPGFMHPVRDKYLEDVLREMGRKPPTQQRVETDKWGGRDKPASDLDLVADVIEHIDKSGEPGAVLCFLPGWQEIKTVQENLETRPHFSGHMILPLHSSLSVADQQKVFNHPPEGKRKIVLTTNVAETSITIDDIVHVVDTGTHKEHSYDPLTKVSCLDTVWTSRSNVTQRKGRAGRCRPGKSYHLFSRDHLESLPPFPIPEILRTPLESLVLQAKIHSPNCKAVEFLSQVLDSPQRDAVRAAVQTLQTIGVLDKTETLTPLGWHVSCMTCDPRLGKVLVLGAMFRCVLPMLSVAACLTKEPFHNSLLNRGPVRTAKEALSGSSHSDYLVFTRVLSGWRKIHREGDRSDRDEYLQKHLLSWTSLRFINGLIHQFSDNLRDAGLVSRPAECYHSNSLYNEQSEQEELLKAVLLAGLYPNLIQMKKGIVTKGRFRPNDISLRTFSGSVLLHPCTVNRRKATLPSRWLTFFSAVKSNGNVFIRDSSPVHPLALLLLTDCDILERVNGDGVEVSFPSCPLVRCHLSVTTWELLRGLRTSIQTMLYRNLNDPANAVANAVQDGELISLLTKLLSDTDANSSALMHNSDSEVQD